MDILLELLGDLLPGRLDLVTADDDVAFPAVEFATVLPRLGLSPGLDLGEHARDDFMGLGVVAGGILVGLLVVVNRHVESP